MSVLSLLFMSKALAKENPDY